MLAGHRHRRTGRRRQGHPGAPARRHHRPQPPRHRPDLSCGRACAAVAWPAAGQCLGCRNRWRARSIWRSSTGTRCRRMTSARPPRRWRSFRRCGAILVEKQRDFARTPPGAVLDGRDIGTVVCPDADVKLYVTATPKFGQCGGGRDRSQRRHRRIHRNPRRYRAPRRARHGPARLTFEAGDRRSLA